MSTPWDGKLLVFNGEILMEGGEFQYIDPTSAAPLEIDVCFDIPEGSLTLVSVYDLYAGTQAHYRVKYATAGEGWTHCLLEEVEAS